MNGTGNELDIERIDLQHEAAVQQLFQSNREYCVRVTGAPATDDAAFKALSELPPGVDAQNKIDLGLWEGSELVGFADLILGWPHADTAHIGLLMVATSAKSRGYGRRMHEEVLNLVAKHPQITRLRISIVQSNADLAEGFWQRMGYRNTGESFAYTAGTVQSTARIWMQPVGRSAGAQGEGSL